MVNKLTRDQLLTEKIPAIAERTAVSRHRGGDESRQETSHSEVERVTYSFDLAEIKSIQIHLNCQGVVINPPRPKFEFELIVEKLQR